MHTQLDRSGFVLQEPIVRREVAYLITRHQEEEIVICGGGVLNFTRQLQVAVRTNEALLVWYLFLTTFILSDYHVHYIRHNTVARDRPKRHRNRQAASSVLP